MKKKRLKISMKKVILSLLIMFSFMYLNQISFASVENAKKEAGYISLNKSVTKEMEPNKAKVTFAVENTAQSAQKASSENNEISNKIIEALKLVTDTKNDVIKTTGFAIRPIYTTTKNGERVIKNYTAVNSVSVETKDINKISKYIDTAISNGANRTEGLSYTFENDKSVCEEQYPILLKDLRNQASILAQAAGSTIDGIKQIGVSCSMDSVVSNGRFYSAKAMLADGVAQEAVSSTPVEPGKVKVRVYVNADFYVK